MKIIPAQQYKKQLSMEIHPAILTPNYNKMLLLVSELEPALPHLDIDVIDWERTDTSTITAQQALSVKTKSKMTFDLMMDHPAHTISELVKDPRVETIIINLECKDALDPLFDLIHFHKKKVGISVNPDNHFYQIVPIFPQIDLVQIYTIEPGRQGAPFLQERLEIIKNLRDFGFDCPIACDGGINPKTIPLLIKAKVDILSIGSAIQEAADPLVAYRNLTNLLK